jgi:hypothetical protein
MSSRSRPVGGPALSASMFDKEINGHANPGHRFCEGVAHLLECTSAAVRPTPQERRALINHARTAGAKDGCSISLMWLLALGGSLLCNENISTSPFSISESKNRISGSI